MAGFSAQLAGRLDAPPWLVWSALTDLAAVPEWLDGVRAVDSAGYGATVGRWRVGKRWISVEILRSVAPRRVELMLREATGFVREVRVEIEIAPAERGTRFGVAIQGEIAGLANALRPWLRLRAEIELSRAVRGFRSWIEDRARASRAQVRRAPEPATLSLPAELAGIDLVGA